MPVLYKNGQKAELSKFATVSPSSLKSRYEDELKRRANELRKAGRG